MHIHNHDLYFKASYYRSHCCDAPVDTDIMICSDCHEHCSIVMDCPECGGDGCIECEGEGFIEVDDL